MFELTIEGPGKNALGSELMRHLRAQLEEAGGRPLLLRGAGDAFSAGLNLKEVASLDADGMASFLRLLDELVCAVFDYPGPTVALVNGHAIAGGCVLAVCCDHRVGDASNARAKIGLNELALGLRFPPRVFRVLRNRLGDKLERAVLTAALHGPAGALEAGYLDEISEDAEAVAKARLEALAAIPAEAYRVAKADLRRGVTDTVAAEETTFLEEVIPVWTAPELKERIAKALKK